MRVLHLYAGNLFGGVERALLTLWRARDLCPHVSTRFALSVDGKLAAELRAASAPVTILGPVRASRPWTVASARRRVRRFAEHERFDVVVTHSLWPHAVFAPGVRRAGVPLVLWLHDVPRPRGWLEHWARRTPPDLLLANSRFTQSRASAVFAGVPIDVQHPPIELQQVEHCDVVRRTIRESLRTPHDAFVILLASRLQPTKGHAVLLEALVKLRAGDVGNCECWIAGAPQRAAERAFLDELRRRANRAGIGARVKFLGHRDDVPHLLAAADVLCQPNTRAEGFGLSLVEGMHAGVAVVASDLGAAPEVVDARSGLLVPPGNADAVATALRAIASGTVRFDPPHARERARALCDPRHALPRLASILQRVPGSAMK